MAENPETIPESDPQQEDFELILFALLIVASLVLGYRNRAKIRTWFDELLGKFK